MEHKIRIVDKRTKEKFLIDDTYLNGYARLCGIYATGVYISLCRHVNKDQYCFPSFKLMANELSISFSSVQRAISTLAEWNIINVSREKRVDGTWKNHAYTLLDKSIWKQKPPVPQNQQSVGLVDIQQSVGLEPAVCGTGDQQSVGLHKETHSEGNTYKETHIMQRDEEVKNNLNTIIELFKNVNPSYKQLFKNKTQRAALARLIKEHGEEKIKITVEALPSIIIKPYAPRITTPLKLEEKLGELIAFTKQQKSALPTVAVIP